MLEAFNAPATLTSSSFQPLNDQFCRISITSSQRCGRWRCRRLRMLVTGSEGSHDREQVESVGNVESVEEMVGKGKKVHAVASAISVRGSLNEALADAAARCFGRLKAGGCSDAPDLAIVFVSARYSVGGVGPYGRESLDTVVRSLKAFLPGTGVVVGCTADGVVGVGVEDPREELDKSAVSLMLCHLPGVTVTPFHIVPDDLPGLDAGQDTWRRLVGGFPLEKEVTPSFITFSDPTFNVRGGLEAFLEGVDFAYPRCPVLGSLASAGVGSGKGNMFVTLPRDVLDLSCSSLRDSGMVGVALYGDIEVDCLVAQGCRPIGPIYEISKTRKSSSQTTIMTMRRQGSSAAPQWAKTHLDSVIEYARPAELNLIESNLCIRVARDVFKQELGEDDFLAREVLGIDGERGGIDVCFGAKEGERVQFCVKDSEFAVGELRKALQKYKRAELANNLVGYSNPPFGALMFGDSGRGRAFLGMPGPEAQELASFTGGIPIGGFFSWCGQVGPAASMSKNDKAFSDTRSFNHHAACVVAFLRRKRELGNGASPNESES